jgi:hypothetical protein
MKRFLMLVAVAAVAGAMYVAAAPGGQRAAPPTAAQLATLKRQVASLSKKLTALKKDEGKVKSAATDAEGFIAGCFVKAGVAPVSQFGDVNGTYGFAYTAAAGGTSTPRTALDLDVSTTPGGFLQGVDPSCVNSSGAAAQAQTHSGGTRLPLRAERAH